MIQSTNFSAGTVINDGTPLPITDYSDSRLCGASLVSPFHHSYKWIESITDPFDPNCNPIADCAARALKLLAAITAIMITVLPALIGRIIQIIHYYTISENEFSHQTASSSQPAEEDLPDRPLPNLLQIDPPEKTTTFYHGTHQAHAAIICQRGFDPSTTSAGAFIGDAAYFAFDRDLSEAYGGYLFEVSLTLQPGQIMFATYHAMCDHWCNLHDQTGNDRSDKKEMEIFRKLHLRKGIRALKYQFIHDRRRLQEAIAVFDPTCITIKKVTQIAKSHLQAAA
jgi:hypothetical protein